MTGSALEVEVVAQERYWYPEDGGAVWVAGYQLVDPATGLYLARDAPELGARGLRIAGLAGAARHHAAALQSELLAPGRPLVLRRDPGNRHDASAIAVHDTGGQQAGWVPRDVAADLAAEIDAGRSWSALALRERRASPRDPRSGVTMLLARAPAIALHVVSARPPRSARG